MLLPVRHSKFPQLFRSSYVFQTPSFHTGLSHKVNLQNWLAVRIAHIGVRTSYGAKCQLQLIRLSIEESCINEPLMAV
jgi:hypothetical protein